MTADRQPPVALPPDTRPVGVFDSGVGGLSVLRALRAELPNEHFIYIADSGHAPYGERGDAYVLARSRTIADYLADHDIKALVIACNTATAAAVHPLRADGASLPVIGVEPAVKPGVTVTRTGHIGVMATRGTLASARFQTLLAAHAGTARITAQACDGLADAIERSARSGDMAQVAALCIRHIDAMGAFGQAPGEIDTVVLGCTHYPFASDQLRAALPPGVQLLDNGPAVARQTARVLHALAPSGSVPAPAKPGHVQLFTTGDREVLQGGARRWLGLDAAAEILTR